MFLIFYEKLEHYRLDNKKIKTHNIKIILVSIIIVLRKGLC